MTPFALIHFERSALLPNATGLMLVNGDHPRQCERACFDDFCARCD
jgi:hypothetical protein